MRRVYPPHHGTLTGASRRGGCGFLDSFPDLDKWISGRVYAATGSDTEPKYTAFGVLWSGALSNEAKLRSAVMTHLGHVGAHAITFSSGRARGLLLAPFKHPTVRLEVLGDDSRKDWLRIESKECSDPRNEAKD